MSSIPCTRNPEIVMRSLTYRLERPETAARLIAIACPHCRWTSRRDTAVLRQDGLVNCPECYALFRAEAAVECGARAKTLH
jgi:hypothetical protein